MPAPIGENNNIVPQGQGPFALPPQVSSGKMDLLKEAKNVEQDVLVQSEMATEFDDFRTKSDMEKSVELATTQNAPNIPQPETTTPQEMQTIEQETKLNPCLSGSRLSTTMLVLTGDMSKMMQEKKMVMMERSVETMQAANDQLEAKVEAQNDALDAKVEKLGNASFSNRSWWRCWSWYFCSGWWPHGLVRRTNG